MRIIGGTWRSRKLIQPPAASTRPMPDRVREAMFSVLGDHYSTPGQLPPIRVADLFAGSGSMGLEALSRGAIACTFVERNRRVVDVLRKNIDALTASDAATVVVADAWRVSLEGLSRERFDLIFLDPPYRDSEDDSQAGLVRRFLERQPCAGETLVLLHHPVGTQYAPEEDDAWRVLDDRRFGSNMITVLML